MLTITTDAAEAIKALLESPGLPDSAGVRISTAALSWNGSGPPLAIELAAGAHPGDRVVRDEGAQVFVAPAVAPSLEDKVLDADAEPGGGLTFSVHDQ
jgi:iron-sulfur cluster assembly protein